MLNGAVCQTVYCAVLSPFVGAFSVVLNQPIQPAKKQRDNVLTSASPLDPLRATHEHDQTLTPASHQLMLDRFIHYAMQKL